MRGTERRKKEIIAISNDDLRRSGERAGAKDNGVKKPFEVMSFTIINPECEWKSQQ